MPTDMAAVPLHHKNSYMRLIGTEDRQRPTVPDSRTERPSEAETAHRAAFQQLYLGCGPRLVQQTFLLTAHRLRSEHCVRRAFELAWTSWDLVAADASPEGWVRATAFDLALSPWHRIPRDATDQGDRLSGRDRQLLGALLQLPRGQRRAMVLHDALGLDWAQTAAEIEASTPAAYGRVVRARLGLARLVPDIAGPDARAPGFGARLGPLLRGAAVRGCPQQGRPLSPPAQVVRRSRQYERALTWGAVGVTALVLGGLVAGLVLGTPWHPPKPPFITHRTGGTVAATGHRAPGGHHAVTARKQPRKNGGVVRMPVQVPGTTGRTVAFNPARALGPGRTAQDSWHATATTGPLRGRVRQPVYGPPVPGTACLLYAPFCPHPAAR